VQQCIEIEYEEKPRFDHLIGMFSDGKISIDDFLEEKQQEKELEKRLCGQSLSWAVQIG